MDKVSRFLREWGHVITLCLGHSLPSLKALPGSPREVRPLQLGLSSGLAGPHPGLAPPPGGICTPAHSLVEAVEAKACTLPGGSCGSCGQPSVPHCVTSVTQDLKPEKCPVAARIYVRF